MISIRSSVQRKLEHYRILCGFCSFTMSIAARVVRSTGTKSVLGPNCMIKYVKIGVSEKSLCQFYANVLINTEERKVADT